MRKWGRKAMRTIYCMCSFWSHPFTWLRSHDHFLVMYSTVRSSDGRTVLLQTTAHTVLHIYCIALASLPYIFRLTFLRCFCPPFCRTISHFFEGFSPISFIFSILGISSLFSLLIRMSFMFEMFSLDLLLFSVTERIICIHYCGCTQYVCTCISKQIII